MKKEYIFAILVLLLLFGTTSASYTEIMNEQNISYKIENGKFIAKIKIDGETCFLKIEPFSEKSVKIHVSRDNIFDPSGLEQYGFINEKSEVDIEVEQNESWILIHAGENLIQLLQDPFSLIINNLTMLYFSWEDNSTRIGFDAFSTEHYFGFGQKFSSIDQTGNKVLEQIRHGPGISDNNSPSGVPFFMNTRGYGFFVDTTYKTVFDLQNVSLGFYHIQTDDLEFRWFYINGPSFKSLLHEYTNITGKPSLPPRWTFGYWQSKFGYRRRMEFMRVARMLRKGDYPADALVLDYYWRNDEGLEWGRFLSRNKKWRGIYRIDKMGFFPLHRKMEQKLHQLGYKIILHEDTDVIRAYENDLPSSWLYYVDGFGGPNSPPIPVVLDFSNPSATEWYWQDLHVPLLYERDDDEFDGVDGFWLDELDWTPEIGEKPYYNGMLPAEMHNLYPNLYNKNIFENMEETGQRGMILTRSSWAGAQRYPWVWSGDINCTFEALREHIIAGQTMGLSGFPFWGHDLGGFQGQPSNELQIRWTAEFGSFSPLFRVHGTGEYRKTSLIGSIEPWCFCKTAQDIFRFYDKLRYRLIPYIYSCAYEATLSGLPIMRALVLEFQDDENCYDQDTEYMFGPAFLVAPVCEEDAIERTVYLPVGKWIDYWNNKIYEGPTEFMYSAPLDILPLFVRAGSIIPMGPVMNYSDEKPLDPLTLNIYPLENSSFTLYEDDGENLNYRSGGFAKTLITVNQSENIIDVYVGKPTGLFDVDNRRYELVINCIEEPNLVKIDEEELDNDSWSYDDEKQKAIVNISVREPGFHVIIERIP